MSTEFEPRAEEGGAARVHDSLPRNGETPLGGARARAAGFRLPSLFLLVTLRLPGWRRAVPIAFPLFVLEDLLESVGRLMSVFSFLSLAFFRKTQVDSGKDRRSIGNGAAGGCERTYSRGPWVDGWSPASERRREREGRFSIEFSSEWGPSWFFFLARVVRALRFEGRFTLVDVAEGASGTEIAIRLV
ncbi:MAG: hypothetical protein ACM3ZO_07475 [Clostridia bacterium]